MSRTSAPHESQTDADRVLWLLNLPDVRCPHCTSATTYRTGYVLRDWHEHELLIGWGCLNCSRKFYTAEDDEQQR